MQSDLQPRDWRFASESAYNLSVFHVRHCSLVIVVQLNMESPGKIILSVGHKAGTVQD